MKFSRIAAASGIAKYPQEMEAVYATLGNDTTCACDLQLIDALQKAYHLFAEFYDVVKETAVVINQDPARNAWVKTAAFYAMGKDVAGARTVPTPKLDGSQVNALLPLYVLLPQIHLGVEKYRERGFSEAEISDILQAFASGIRIVQSQIGMPGVNALYYYWLTLHVKTAIFNTCGLQFELRYVPNAAIYLKNKRSGEIIMLATNGAYHRSGVQILGSAGFQDEDGAFSADYKEDEECYYGYPIVDSRAVTERVILSKADWQCVLRPGERCLSLHIPRGADISVENMSKAIISARQIVMQRFPEHTGMAVFGSSWILDPTLKKLLGNDSKIAQLIDMFRKYPQKSGGDGVFGYVFPKKYESLESLPENTSLQRKLKQHYLNGGYIYDYAGFIL